MKCDEGSPKDICDKPLIVLDSDRKRDGIAKKFGAVAAYEDEKSGLVKVLLRGECFNEIGCVATLADRNGKRLTDLEFDYLDNSSDGFFEVHVPGKKFGYIDTSGKMAIQPIYDWTQHFREGLAWVVRDGQTLIIDKRGKEIVPEAIPGEEYMEVQPFFHGLARFSIVDFADEDGFKSCSLAFHHDDEENAGIWGYVNRSGKIVVKPQYIFAEDFVGGLAVVCKGKWTYDKKWDNEYSQGRPWSERMDWGAIDTRGREVIPCKFLEIKWRPFDSAWEWKDNGEITKHYLAALDSNDLWGIIDFKGNWVVAPQFQDMGYEWETSPDGDMFVFYARPIWGGGDPDETPCGIYSISRQRVIVPADKFVDIEFKSNKTIIVRETSNGPERTVRLRDLDPMK